MHADEVNVDVVRDLLQSQFPSEDPPHGQRQVRKLSG